MSKVKTRKTKAGSVPDDRAAPGSSAAGAERARMADAGHPENGWSEASP